MKEKFNKGPFRTFAENIERIRKRPIPEAQIRKINERVEHEETEEKEKSMPHRKIARASKREVEL